jgi:hypothetical protein
MNPGSFIKHLLSGVYHSEFNGQSSNSEIEDGVLVPYFGLVKKRKALKPSLKFGFADAKSSHRRSVILTDTAPVKGWTRRVGRGRWTRKGFKFISIERNKERGVQRTPLSLLIK